MPWQGIWGHDAVVDKFRHCLARGRLASTYLFVGPHGIGKRSLAIQLAKALLCPNSAPQLLEPCGTCESCRLMHSGSHPDLEQVSKPPDKSSLPVELLIGSRERRMQEDLCHTMSLKPFLGQRRIAIIDDADDLNEEGANSLLKTLEEPPAKALFILLGTSAEKQLPTIRSRAQIIRFQPLEEELVARLLIEKQLLDDPPAAQHAARYSGGSLRQALELADAAVWQFRGQLLQAIARPGWNPVELAPELLAQIDRAGKEAAARRVRARQLVWFVAELYRAALYLYGGAPLSADEQLTTAARQLASQWNWGSEALAAAVDRSLSALEQIDRNAHQANLVEAWLDELAQISRGMVTATGD